MPLLSGCGGGEGCGGTFTPASMLLAIRCCPDRLVSAPCSCGWLLSTTRPSAARAGW